MLGKLKRMVGFRDDGNTELLNSKKLKITESEITIVNGMVIPQNLKEDAGNFQIGQIGEGDPDSRSCFKGSGKGKTDGEEGISILTVSPKPPSLLSGGAAVSIEPEENNLNNEHAGRDPAVLQKEANLKNGRLPAMEKFWNYLAASGRSRRTITTYRYSHLFWKKEFERGVYFLTTDKIESVIKDMHPSTAKKHIAFLRKLGKWYLREGKSGLHMELTKLEVPKQAQRLPADRGAEMFVKYRDLARTWCREGRREGVWLGLMLLAGLRISEIRTAQTGEQGGVRVLGKGNKERITPVSDWLVEAMQTQKGKGQGGWRMGRKTVWQGLAKQGIRHPHSLRHTYASELLRRGKRIEDAKILLGHANVATTNIYLKLDVPAGVPALLDA